MMDSVVKAKWLEALRSGEYKQGKNFLCAGDSYCCLGVLGDIMGLEHTAGDDPDRKKVHIFYYERGTFIGNLPSGFFGLRQNELRELTKQNDFDSKSFTEIADWIEENL